MIVPQPTLIDQKILTALSSVPSIIAIRCLARTCESSACCAVTTLPVSIIAIPRVVILTIATSPTQIIASLSTLLSHSDDVVVDSIDRLALQGAAHERAVIEHLIEVENRELHLRLAEPSMFEFARKRLKASESTTYRRLRVARLAREMPAWL